MVERTGLTSPCVLVDERAITAGTLSCHSITYNGGGVGGVARACCTLISIVTRLAHLALPACIVVRTDTYPRVFVAYSRKRIRGAITWHTVIRVETVLWSCIRGGVAFGGGGCIRGRGLHSGGGCIRGRGVAFGEGLH